MAQKRWFGKEERKEARARAKDSEKFMWSYVRERGRGDVRQKEKGHYVGMNLPGELRKPGVEIKLLFEPKGR